MLLTYLALPGIYHSQLRMFRQCGSFIASVLAGSYSEDSDEESGKDWDELEEEARRGKNTDSKL
jgi:hypothetical protein